MVNEIKYKEGIFYIKGKGKRKRNRVMTIPHNTI